jgi:uncharacterized protein (UPF0548 family)
MIFFRKPDYDLLSRILRKKKNTPFTYSPVGYTITGRDAPNGFHLNRYEALLGKGHSLYVKCCEAIREGRMYKTPFSYVFSDDNSHDQGSTLLVVAGKYFIWTVNPVRIVTIGNREVNGDMLFFMTSGTLRGHEEQGEECFTARYSKAGDVHYEIYSFYRSSRFFLIFFNPVVKLVVDQFDRESSGTMQKICKT